MAGVVPLPESASAAAGVDPDQCRSALDADLGWALGAVFRAYVKSAEAAVADLPGGPRGYQVLAAAARDLPGTQLALAHQLGIDRTVMTYLLDDLERAGLVERRPDPADRRARRVTATEQGRLRVGTLERELRLAEEHVLAPLAAADREAFRGLLQRLATAADRQDPVGSTCDVVEEMR
jgi:DNA-binding MarR family transcriptional regulator